MIDLLEKRLDLRRQVDVDAVLVGACPADRKVCRASLALEGRPHAAGETYGAGKLFDPRGAVAEVVSTRVYGALGTSNGSIK